MNTSSASALALLAFANGALAADETRDIAAFVSGASSTWFSVGNAASIDGQCASAGAGAAPLLVSNWGFSNIPADAAVVGIEVTIAGSSILGPSSISLSRGGLPVGTSEQVTFTPFVGNLCQNLQVLTVGGAGSTWGQNWTAPDIRAADFGVYLVPATSSSPRTSTAIDGVMITVFYGPQLLIFRNGFE